MALSKHPKFTVFTPIYNRKHTIHRVWDSLNAQTNKDFEWLIVNDGSKDGIEPLLEQYVADADFEVRVFHQENSGKHIAFNKAIDEARGTLLIPADSDDGFIPTTVAIFDEYWEKNKSETLSGISVLCLDEQNNIVGDKFPSHEMISDYVEMAYKYQVKGEKWGCIRVDVMRKFKFPQLKGANFFPESYVWNQIALHYKTLYLNEALRIYYQDAGNQLMKVKKKSMGALRVENYYAIWWINTMIPKVGRLMDMKDRLKSYIGLWTSSFRVGKGPLSVLKELNRTSDKLLALLLFIPAFIFIKLFK